MAESRYSRISSVVAAVAVVFIILLAISVLMPSLRHAKESALQRSLSRGQYDEMLEDAPASEGGESRQTLSPAKVTRFDAKIDLTPMLSVGTDTPESIYRARFEANLQARKPAQGPDECEIRLPLPPQIISLAEINFAVNGDPDDTISVAHGELLWRGQLPTGEDANVSVSYEAVGKGIYTLQKPPGRIVDHFRTELIAHHSDIRMLELSLQPQDHRNEPGKTIYVWDYKRLLIARPIQIDVLGIAAVDRLGELVWLGPVTVLGFGLLVILAAAAHDPAKVNVWTTILLVGCFAAAYPLMYFLQDFASLPVAVGIAAGVVLVILAVRSITLLGRGAGVFAGVVLPAVLLALSVTAALYTRPAVQGVVLTLMAIFVLVSAMVLLPGAQAKLKTAMASPAGKQDSSLGEENQQQD